MSRWLAVAALGTAFLALPAFAQRHGGGGFSHGGFGGGFASHGSFGGFHGGSFGGFSSRGSFGFSHGPMMSHGFSSSPRMSYRGAWSRPGGWGRSGWGGRGPYYRGYPYRHRYWAYGGYGYPYYGYPWYGDPGYWDWWDDNGYSNQSGDYSYQPNYGSDGDSRQQAEIDRLHDEVQRLREQRGTQAAIPRPPETHNLDQPTEIIFRDRHSEKVENYAIVGQNLWIFEDERSRKVALADLDIQATEKANQDRGVDFQLPR